MSFSVINVLSAKKSSFLLHIFITYSALPVVHPGVEFDHHGPPDNLFEEIIGVLSSAHGESFFV